MANRVRILIDLERGESLQGSLRDQHGTERAFTGWLGLVAAIENALGRSDTQGDVIGEAGNGPHPKPTWDVL